jgi:mRNA interferase RelE/StbE
MRQPRQQQERLLKAIYRLPEGDVTLMKGTMKRYRLRVGDYRILYELRNEKMIILVVAIGSRGDVYK